MTYSSGAQFRQPIPDLPESELRETVSPPEAPSPKDETVLRLRLLWAGRRLLFRVAAVAFIASAVIALLIPVRFESMARLMPPDNQSASGLAAAVAAMSGGMGGGLGAIASEFLGLKSTSEIFVGILTSRTAEDKLVERFDLKKVYGTRRIEDARKVLASATEIQIDRKDQMITITVTDHDPKRAQALTQAYVEELNRLLAELSTSSARRERIFLEGRLQTVTKDLESAEKEFSQFSSKNSTLDIKEQGKAMVEAAATLQGQLIAAESELEGLRQIYTDDNVRVRSVHARVAELKDQLRKIAGKDEDLSAPIDHQDSLYPSIRKLPLVGVTYADLYRQAKVQETIFETLTKEYELAKVQEAKEIPVVKVLDTPDLPDKKSFPPRTLIVLFGTAFALVVATTWIFGKATWERMDSSDPRRVFAEEVFKHVRERAAHLRRRGLSGNNRIPNSWNLLRRERDDQETDR